MRTVLWSSTSASNSEFNNDLGILNLSLQHPEGIDWEFLVDVKLDPDYGRLVFDND